MSMPTMPGVNTTDPSVINAASNWASSQAQIAYNQAKLAGDADTLAFQKANAAMTQAMNMAGAFGWAPGGDWTSLGSLAANAPPMGTPTLASGQATGAIGYIPGFTGVNAGQTMGELSGAQGMAQNAAGLTGWYAAPRQSEYTPGTFVRLDPGTYDTARYGDVQISYVLPSGQLQRVNIPQAKAMGWNGDLTTMNVLPASKAQMLELAPPQNFPQQTLAGLSQYSNLNSAAINQAVAQAGQTGMYQAPAQVLPPGTNYGGQKFQDLDQGTQQAYFYSNGGDWNAAMNKWVADSNNAARQAVEAAGGTWNPGQAGGPGGPGTPQETLSAQQQYFAQAQALAGLYGKYYAPGAPGQAGQAGVNAPQVGDLTLPYQQFQQDTANRYLTLLSNLRGPADWAQYQKVLGATPGGMTDLVRAAAGQYVPGSGATTGVNPNAVTLGGFVNQATGQPQQQELQSAQGALVAPNQMAPQTWNALQPSQQQMLLGVWESQGYNQDDAVNLFKQALPKYATGGGSAGSFRLQ